MHILAVDTSGPICGVAILADDGLRCEHMVVNKRTHSVNLMPMIDGAFTATGLALQSMDRIAVVVGPGSFTGVRLGVSTVKGLAHGSGKPCVAVDALEAMAAGAGAFDGVICPIQDARAGQVYGAAFTAAEGSRPHRLMEDTPIALERYAEKLQTLGGRFLFLGDGMPVHREALKRLLGDRAIFAPAPMSCLRPGAVAWLASLTEEEVDALSLQPLYLRAPSAERNRLLVEAAHAE